MTEYLILAKTEDGSWVEGRTVPARGAKAAIRTFLDGSKLESALFVAVPARSWKPVTVKVETKTALKFS